MTTLFQRMRNVWGGSSQDQTAEPVTPKSPRTNPWQEVFDPNTNPNMKKGGRSYYDHVDPNKKEPSCWDYVLQSQNSSAGIVKEKAFESVGGSKDAPVDAAELRKMFDPKHVENIMKMADKNNDGKIDFNEFCDMLRKY